MDVFKIVCESQQMDGWNDSLGKMTDAVNKKLQNNVMSFSDLEMVAGGIRHTGKMDTPDRRRK